MTDLIAENPEIEPFEYQNRFIYQDLLNLISITRDPTKSHSERFRKSIFAGSFSEPVFSHEKKLPFSLGPIKQPKSLNSPRQ